jgi:WD40 repeat protein
MWNIHTQQLERQFRRRSKSNSWCGFAGPGGEFVIGADEMDVLVWDRKTGRVLKRHLAHADNIRGVVVNPHHPLEFVSYSTDRSFIVYELSFIVMVLGGGLA